MHSTYAVQQLEPKKAIKSAIALTMHDHGGEVVVLGWRELDDSVGYRVDIEEV
jgi:hypothetical protein